MKKQIILLGFLMGIIFCASYTNKNIFENFAGRNSSNCPDMLVRKGNKIMLLNNRKARIPGINPIFFDNLEEYVEFYHWQKSQGLDCPVLYFNEVEDAQGNSNFRMLNSPLNPQGGLPSYKQMAQEVPLYDANHDNPPWNKRSYPGQDPNNQNAGRYTPLDKAFHSRNSKSANAMDVNWAGREYSRRMVQSGKYNKDHVNLKKFDEFRGIKNPQFKQTNKKNNKFN